MTDYPPPGPVRRTRGRKALLTVSFGTTDDANRELSIGGIERALQQAYPDYEVRRAFTSHIVIDRLAARGTPVDTVPQALDKLVAAGVTSLVIQPATVMAGIEYNQLVKDANNYNHSFHSFAIGAPLLTSQADFDDVAAAIVARTATDRETGAGVVLVGHGTNATAHAVYAQLDKLLADQGQTQFFVGTIEGRPTIDDVIGAVQLTNRHTVILKPLMIVAGDHANNDIAGAQPDSWASRFRAAGFTVRCLIEGLGEDPAIQRVLVNHAQTAISHALTSRPHAVASGEVAR